MLVLYHANNSYASQKVRIYLAENHISWKSYAIDLLKQEHLTNPVYRKIHPRALVPALQDGEKIICNSTEIMEYLAAHYLSTIPDRDKKLLTEVHDFCKADEGLHDPYLRVLSYHYLWMHNEPSVDETERVLAIAAEHADRARGAFLARAIQKQLTVEEIVAAKKAVLESLAEIEKLLEKSKSDFLFGQTYTMADAVATVRLVRIHSLRPYLDLAMKNYPLTERYFQKMQERPSYAEINATHGKDV